MGGHKLQGPRPGFKRDLWSICSKAHVVQLRRLRLREGKRLSFRHTSASFETKPESGLEAHAGGARVGQQSQRERRAKAGLWISTWYLPRSGSQQVQNNKNNPEKGSEALGILLNYAVVEKAFAVRSVHEEILLLTQRLGARATGAHAAFSAPE